MEALDVSIHAPSEGAGRRVTHADSEALDQAQPQTRHETRAPRPGRSIYGGRLYGPKPEKPKIHWAQIFIAREHKAKEIAEGEGWVCICQDCRCVREVLAAAGGSK